MLSRVITDKYSPSYIYAYILVLKILSICLSKLGLVKGVNVEAWIPHSGKLVP